MQQSFPLSPSLFNGRSRVVEPGICFDWLRYGWAMTLADPGRWLTVTLVCVLVGVVGWSMPWIGLLLICPLIPGWIGAIFLMCRARDEGRTIKLADILQELRPHKRPLIGLGLLLALAVLLARTGLVLLWGNLSSLGIHAMLFGLIGSIGIILILLLPCLMALYFAPGLLAVHAMPVAMALRASFHGCLKNIFPFLIFGLLLSILLCFALLSLGLGLFVLIPVWSGAVYASYRDIFVGI